MKIEIEKRLVELIPENSAESASLERLWRMLIDCNGPAKPLVPVGEFLPSDPRRARAAFVIEGAVDSHIPPPRAERDISVYCNQCNRLETIKAGDEIPVCCGRLMEIVD